jgi:hypothetical protein
MPNQTPPDWADIIGSVSDVGQLLAVLVGLYLAWRGLDSWRSEMVGRRRAELAERTLASIYEAAAHMAWVRAPGSFGGEGASRPGRDDDEAEHIKRKRDAYYTPIERLNKQAEFWGRFLASRFEFQAIFGTEEAQPLEEMRKVRNDVFGAAQDLLEIYSIMPDRRAIEAGDEIRSHEQAIGWGRSKGDPVGERISAAVKAMEQFCRPAIDGYHRERPAWWKWPRKKAQTTRDIP